MVFFFLAADDGKMYLLSLMLKINFYEKAQNVLFKSYKFEVYHNFNEEMIMNLGPMFY